MPEGNERHRIEIGFRSGQGFSALVGSNQIDELESLLKKGGDGVIELDTEDGTYLVVVSQVDYLKRFSRETRIGFAGGA
jgi:hypothetical protein